MGTGMKRLCGAVALVAAASLLAAPAGSAPMRLVVPSLNDRYVVGFRAQPSRALLERLITSGLRGIAPLTTIDAAIVQGPYAVIERIAGMDGVSYVEPDGVAHLNNYQTAAQTGEGKLRNGAPPLPKPLTGKGVTVAVVDSGIDTNHGDLAGQVADDLFFEAAFPLAGIAPEDVRDEVIRTVPGVNRIAATHGLSVGGVIAGTGEMAQGGVDMRGLAPGARLVDFNTCCATLAGEQVTKQDLGHGTTVILAYDYMLRHRKDFPGGIRVASNQWGFALDEPYPSRALHAILRKTMAAGIAVVFSAGNYGPAPNTVDYPMKAVPEIITMGVSCPAIEGGREVSGPGSKACGRGDIAEYSSRGPALDLTAPGAGLWAPKNASYITQDSGDLPPPHDDPAASAWNRLWYGKFGGTSAAAPYASGVIALMLEANPKLTAAQIHRILKVTAHDYGVRGFDTTFGWGEIDAYRAVKAALALKR
jgi:serine protease AprX